MCACNEEKPELNFIDALYERRN